MGRSGTGGRKRSAMRPRCGNGLAGSVGAGRQPGRQLYRSPSRRLARCCVRARFGCGMVGETNMNRNASQDGRDKSAGVDGSTFRRLLDLMELQAELFKVDARDGFGALAPPAILIGGGVVAAFAGIVALLLAVAALLNQWAGWSVTLSLFTAGVLALLLAAGAVLLGWQLTRKALATFDRSTTEFRNNLDWLKTTLSHPSHERSERQRSPQT